MLGVLVLLPFLGAILPWLTAPFGRRITGMAAAIMPVFALSVVLSQAPAVFSGEILTFSMPWLPMLGLEFAIRLDGLSWLFSLLITGIGLLIVIYAHYYLPAKDDGARFFSLLLLFMGAMLGMVVSDNLLLLVVFWELTSISSFLLIGYKSDDSGARKGARMALAVTGAGGLALLGGVVLIGQITGTYALGEVLAQGDLIRGHALYPLVLVLVLLGAFTKSAQFPFHFWLSHAMAAPTPVSAYLHSATMVKAGVFLLARLYPAIAGTDLWAILVTSVGLATLLIGACTAMFRHDLKGLLAFSTMSHLGLITMLFGLNSAMATVAALFHIINHATFKASLFMAAGIIDHETGTRDMRELGGLRRYMPHTAALAMVAAAAMAGVPLLNGFISKEKFFMEALQTRLFGDWHQIVPLVAVIAASFSVAYSIRFIVDVFFGEPSARVRARPPHEPPRFMKVPSEILVALCLLVGMMPVLVVGPLLTSAVAATLGTAEAPPFDLHLWHGFNMAVVMSAIAMIFGVLIYVFRKPMHAWHARLPDVDARHVFEQALQGLTGIAGWLSGTLVNGSLQRYVVLLLIMAIGACAVPLWNWPYWNGGVPQSPVDAVSLTGAFILAVAALAAVFTHRQRMVSLIQLSAVGLIVSLAFARFSAPDLALTQISVEVVTIVFLMMALYFLPQYTPRESSRWRIMRDAGISIAAGGGIAALTWAVLTRPFTTISDYFLTHSVPDGGGSNVVNVILVDFRGFDTMGEITVLAIAALGVYALLDRVKLDAPGMPVGYQAKPHPLIMTVVAKPMLPIALMVAVYIFLRGHNLPGGGFIAGLITAIALILQFVAHGLDWTQDRLGRRYHPLLASGLLIAMTTGLGSWWFGYPFLTSTHDHFHLPLIGDVEIASAMFFDLGVFMVVVAATLVIISKLGAVSEHRTPHNVEAP